MLNISQNGSQFTERKLKSIFISGVKLKGYHAQKWCYFLETFCILKTNSITERKFKVYIFQ